MYNLFVCIYFCCTATDTFREIHQIGEDLDFCIFFWIHPEVLQVIGSAHVVQQPQQSQFSLSVPQKGIRLEVWDGWKDDFFLESVGKAWW